MTRLPTATDLYKRKAAKLKLRVISLALLLLLPTAVSAKSTGADLLRQCRVAHEYRKAKGDDFIHAAACLNYLQGFVEGYFAASIAAGEKSTGICFPKSLLTNEQKVAIFVKWMDKNPKDWHQPQLFTAVAAFHDAFPCK